MSAGSAWNWGTGIAIAYTAFAVATTGFVAFAMHRPVPLVRPDYYAESLREDQRMAARARARDAGASIAVADDGEAIVLTIPAALAAAARGTVTFYRASDARADRTFAFAPDARGRQALPVRDLPRGHWIVTVRWTGGGLDYDVEQAVRLR